MTRPASPPLDRNVGEELVRRLATDDAFRERLARSPAEALAEYDIELPAAALPADVVLPPRSQLVAALRAMAGGHLAPARASLPPRPKFWPALRMAVQPAAR